MISFHQTKLVFILDRFFFSAFIFLQIRFPNNEVDQILRKYLQEIVSFSNICQKLKFIPTISENAMFLCCFRSHHHVSFSSASFSFLMSVDKDDKLGEDTRDIDISFSMFSCTQSLIISWNKAKENSESPSLESAILKINV